MIRYNFYGFDKYIKIFNKNIFSTRYDKKNNILLKILGKKIYQFSASINLKNNIIKSAKTYPKKTRIYNYTTLNYNKTLIEKIVSLSPFYFLPNKGNLGDVVIASCELILFDQIGVQYTIIDEYNCKKITHNFNLIYGGGGIWTNNYKKDTENIIEIFKKENLKKLLILPSSFNKSEHFTSIINEKFCIFCRENKSFEYLKSSSTNNNIYMANDIVIDADLSIYETSYSISNKEKNNDIYEIVYKIYPYYKNILYRTWKFIEKTKENNVLYALRNDIENNFSIIPKNNFDLSSVVNCELCQDKTINILLTKIFLCTINLFDIIITDRLHIAICSAKIGKKVYLIDNSYGKNSSVFQKLIDLL